MAKFAIDFVYTRTFMTSYVIEAEDELEASRMANDLIDDYEFQGELADEMHDVDYDYEVGDITKIDDDALAKAGEFFWEG